MAARSLYFAGKGGNGKTTMACATAIHYADLGLKVLIVACDPSPSLGDLFGQPVGREPAPIQGIRSLWAMQGGPGVEAEFDVVIYDDAPATVRDPAKASFTFVLQPEATSVSEAAGSIEKLRDLGADDISLIVNGVIPFAETINPFFRERSDMQQFHLETIREKLPYPTKIMFLLDTEVSGVTGLRKVAGMLYGVDADYRVGNPIGLVQPGLPDLPPKGETRTAALVRLLPGSGTRHLFFAGKGGAGKTVLSSATAVWLARRGLRTLLATTAPLEDIGEVLGTEITREPISHPEVATLSAVHLADLAGFESLVSTEDWEVVVVDARLTAQTAKEELASLADLMRDPSKCTVAHVMYPEHTPMVESARTIEELRSLGIEPGLVLANLFLPAEACSTPYAAARRRMQERYLAEALRKFDGPVLLIPMLPTEVAGIDMLENLGNQVYGE